MIISDVRFDLFKAMGFTIRNLRKWDGKWWSHFALALRFLNMMGGGPPSALIIVGFACADSR